MFNEVYKSCPRCGTQCDIQIPQIVLGFGCFDLESLNNISELSKKDLYLLKKYIQNKTFYCNCGYSFASQTVDNKYQIYQYLNL
jgi:hypothetical protein